MNNQHQKSVFLYEKEYDVSENNLVAVDLKCPIMEYTYLIVSNTTLKDQQRNIEELSSRVTSSEDVKTLLEYVNWRMFIYLCKQACTYSRRHFQDLCSNSSCSFTNSTDDLFFPSSQCRSVISEPIGNIAIKVWYIFSLFGLLCLLGNVGVIYDEITSFLNPQNKVKEIQIYRALVLNLALADLLMGIYVTAISFEIKRKATVGVYFSEPGLCNVLGVLVTTSTQGLGLYGY